MKIIDATLREGCQSPDVCFDQSQSRTIAQALLAAGVDMVECGHPSASAGEAARTHAVVRACKSTPVLAHARACPADIQAVAEAGASWVGIFLGLNEITRRARVRGRTVNELLALIGDSVTFACSLGLSVRYSLEDASRTSDHLMLAAYTAAVEAGAHRICYADSVGILEPSEVHDKVGLIKRMLN